MYFKNFNSKKIKTIRIRINMMFEMITISLGSVEINNGFQ